jgi:hypothetical protein
MKIKKAITCEILGCDEIAMYVTEMDNYICESHMNQEIEENDYEPEEYELLELEL